MRSLAERWSALEAAQRLAAIAAAGLLATLFLPWYEKSAIPPGQRAFVRDAVSGLGSADFVMASVLVVGVAVLGMLWARSERRAFHLPGGDGTVIALAGLWAAFLIFYRVLDHPDFSSAGSSLSVGIQWGVFVAFLAAAALVVAGARLRAAGRPEPSFDRDPTLQMSGSVPRRRPRRPGRVERPADEERPTRATRQMSLDELDTERLRDRPPPRRP